MLRFPGISPAVRRSEVEMSGRAGGATALPLQTADDRLGLSPAGAVLPLPHLPGLLAAGGLFTSV